MVEPLNTPKTNEPEHSEEEISYGDYLILSARQGDLEAIQECLEAEVSVNH